MHSRLLCVWEALSYRTKWMGIRIERQASRKEGERGFGSRNSVASSSGITDGRETRSRDPRMRKGSQDEEEEVHEKTRAEDIHAKDRQENGWRDSRVQRRYFRCDGGLAEEGLQQKADRDKGRVGGKEGTERICDAGERTVLS